MNTETAMTSLKALMFDLDGTLIDTELTNATAYASALTNFGFPFTGADILPKIIGRHWTQFLPGLTRCDPMHDIHIQIVERKHALYPNLIQQARVNEPLIDLIQCNIGIFKIALVTTASRQTVNTILPLLGLEHCFDAIVTGCDVSHRKPHPEAYQCAADLLNVTSDQCLVFEDSETGINSALAFGARVLKVLPFSQR